MVGAIQVTEQNEIMLITNAGTLVRTRVSEVSIIGRNTGGVRLIRTMEGEEVVSLERIAEPEVDDDESLLEAAPEGSEAPLDDAAVAEQGDDE